MIPRVKYVNEDGNEHRSFVPFFVWGSKVSVLAQCVDKLQESVVKKVKVGKDGALRVSYSTL